MHLQLASTVVLLTLLKMAQCIPRGVRMNNEIVLSPSHPEYCDNGGGLTPDPSSCIHYYHCNYQHKSTRLVCEGGTAYNHRQEMCDKESYLVCFYDYLEISEEIKERLIEELDQAPNRFTMFWSDKRITTTTTTSPSISITESTTTKVVAPLSDENRTKRISKPDPQHTEPELRKRQVDTTPPSITDTQPCTVGQVANVPNPNNCTKYTFCDNGFGENLVCPTGQLFDSLTTKCMQASQARCCECPLFITPSVCQPNRFLPLRLF
jgi:hypothetical protein